MVASLHHRGPDHRGFYECQRLAMGMARLAVIDLAGGNQPIANEDETVWVVMNGEIYNFAEIRANLESRGHRFRTRSDTESVVHAYEEWGPDCVTHLRGMFALAIWDVRQQRLVLARDRLGEKPLFIARTASHLAFASEMKAIPRRVGFESTIDIAALDEYLTFGFIAAPRSIYRGVRKLPAAHVAIVEHGTVTERRYWQPKLTPLPFRAQAEAEEELGPLLRDAVTSQMVSDAPLGAFLSGGIDSSLIVALMAQAAPGRVRTFCVGFEEAGFDERPHARAVAEFLGTDHEDWVVRPNVVEILPALVRHFDEPFGDKSLVPMHIVAKMARQRVTVALSGDGGDEAFGGYVSYATSATRWRRHARRPRWLNQAIVHAARLYPRRLPRSFAITKRGYDERQRFVAGGMAFDPDDKRRLYAPELSGQLAAEETLADRFALIGHTTELELVSSLQYIDMMRYLPDDVLVKVDRMTMANSLESRAPLLDHRVVEFGLRLPEKFKVAGGVTKKILRDLASDLLPPDILARPKKGFGLPVREWLMGPLAPMVHDVVLGKSMRDTGWFDQAALAGHIERARRGGRAVTQLWLLLCLGLWLSA